MNELEKIKENLHTWNKKWGDHIPPGLPRSEFDAILRDLRGIKVVLPETLRTMIEQQGELRLGYDDRGYYAEQDFIDGGYGSIAADSKESIEQAIAALAEKITKEKGA